MKVFKKYMMMKKLILLALLCLATMAEAQNQKGTFSIKPMAGINISTFGSPTIEDMYHAKVRFTAGAEAEYGVNDKMKTDVTSATITVHPLDPYTMQEMGENTSVVTQALVNLTDVCKSVDFGIPVGLSYEYKNVSLDARYYFGLTRMDKTEDPDTAKNRYFSITLGYRFHL